MTTIVKGRPPSTEIRAQLKAEGRTVLVAMSLGKDPIATNLALKAEGIPTELAYLYYIPGTEGRRTLKFIHKTITELEEAFEQTIHLYPHPSLYRWLTNFVFQPPERLAVIEAAQLLSITYEQPTNKNASSPPQTANTGSPSHSKPAKKKTDSSKPSDSAENETPTST